jgi:hypothetical protein
VREEDGRRQKAAQAASRTGVWQQANSLEERHRHRLRGVQVTLPEETRRPTTPVAGAVFAAAAAAAFVAAAAVFSAAAALSARACAQHPSPAVPRDQAVRPALHRHQLQQMHVQQIPRRGCRQPLLRPLCEEQCICPSPLPGWHAIAPVLPSFKPKT